MPPPENTASAAPLPQGGSIPRGIAAARPVEAVALVVVACLSLWVLAALHDQFWWAPDDGAFAHVAQRILAGEVLHRDVQDVHAGYVNFANASALALFGPSLASLRYPLALLTFIQSCLMFLLLLPRGAPVAAAGAFGMTALTFVLFLNPTAHWYALFVLVCVVAVLSWLPPANRWRLAAAGFALMTLFLFRQLSGIVVAIGVLTWMLCEAPADDAAERRPADLLLARLLLAVMGLGLAGYLALKIDPFAALLFGVGPLGIILWAGFNTRMGNRATAKMLGGVAAGAAVGLLPLLAYHIAHGSVAAWIDDSVLAAFRLTELSFFSSNRFIYLLFYPVYNLFTGFGATALVNAVYWVGLLLLAPAVAVATLRALSRRGRASGLRPHLLPVLAMFYALVSVHYQIPIYLCYTVGMSLAALLWLTTARPGRMRAVMVGFAVFLSATGLYFHAGQPLTRAFAGIMTGVRAPALVESGLERAGLRVSAEDAALYRDLVRLIRRETPPDGAILALPVDPELYFLSNRRNPTRFFNSALGMTTERDVQDVLAILGRDRPWLVFFKPKDKYNTTASARVMEWVRAHYDALPGLGDFEIYRRRPAQAGDASR